MTNTIYAKLPIIIVGSIIALSFGVTSFASAQTNGFPEWVTQEQIDAALADLGDIYGSPVVRVDQARAICDDEQYFLECAEIGKRHNLFDEARVEQVDAIVSEIRGNIVDQLKQCTSVDCLVEVANTLAEQLNKNNPNVAAAVDLTLEKVEEKRVIVETARELGVDFEQCRFMDPDTASVDLLRACARLAQDVRIQNYIPEESRMRAGRVDATIALKEGLATGEIQCGDGTVEGCGNFCLNTSSAQAEQGVSAIPPICRQIAERYFGPDGIRELEAAHSNVQRTFSALSQPQIQQPSDICSRVDPLPCPSGEYRQTSRNALGCPAFGACIPISTNTTKEETEIGRAICPAMPTVISCGIGQEKFVEFTSPECGTYYGCRDVRIIEAGIEFPYTFNNGKRVASLSEARAYCNQNPPGSGQGVADECEARLGVVYPTVDSVRDYAVCDQYGFGWHPIDQSGNCFSPNNSEYRTPGGTLQRCESSPVYGCSDSNTAGSSCPSGQYWSGTSCVTSDSWPQDDTNVGSMQRCFYPNASIDGTPPGYTVWCESDYYNCHVGEPSGESVSLEGLSLGAPSSCEGGWSDTATTHPSTSQGVNQTWNNLGLQSWIREDADPARISSIKQACAHVGPLANVWTPNAGDYASKDFGMPDPEKCASQAKPECSDGIDNDGDKWIDYPNDSGCDSAGDDNETYEYKAPPATVNNYAGDENSCPGFAYSRWDSTGKRYCQLNAEVKCSFGYPNYLTSENYMEEHCPADQVTTTSNTTGACSSELYTLLGSGCHSMGNAWFNGEKTQYVMPGTNKVMLCASSWISNCSSASTPSSSTSSGASWTNKTWKFADGSTQYSSILSRTDTEYTTFIDGVYNDCKTKYFAGWKPNAGTDSNWQEFGVPSCTSTQPTAASPTYTTTSSTCGSYTSMSTCSANSTCRWDPANYCTSNTTYSGSYSGSMERCFYPNATIDGTPPGYTVWCESDYYNCHVGEPSGATVSTTGLTLGAPSACESGWSSGSTGGDYGSCGNYTSQSSCTGATNCYWYDAGGSSYCYYDSGSGSTYGDCTYNGSESSCTAQAGCSWYGSYCQGDNYTPSSTSCPSDQWWDSSTSSCRSSSDACIEAGGTWDSGSNYCSMPTSYFCPSGHDWNGSHCTFAQNPSQDDMTASVLRAVLSIFGIRF